MKKLLFIFIILLSPSVFGGNASDWREQSGYYDGDPNENIILEKGDDYIVIRNLTAKSRIPLKIDGETWWYEPAEVFLMEAKKFCKKHPKHKSIEELDLTTFDEHTIIIGCLSFLRNIFIQKFKNHTEEQKEHVENYSSCFSWEKEFNKKTFDYYDCKRKMKKVEKFWPEVRTIAKENYEQTFKYINNREIIYEIKKRVLAKGNQPSFSTEDQNTIVAASSGTGFFVSTSGHMVTNYHVIEECNSVKVHYKGSEKEAQVLFTDKTNDLAIIKANLKPDKVYAVSDEDVSLLEDIIVAGFPLGKKISASIKTSKGSVTALAGYGDNYSNFQIDAPLNSGNSGGPIMNQKGNIVGVAVATYGKDIGVESFNFGVKSSMLKIFANANKLEFMPASKVELTNKDLGKLITEATIYLECWMSVAKIKQFIAEEESRKAFFSDYK